MPYGETKVYFDGSHYIAIPHTTRPAKKRPKSTEELITVFEENDCPAEDFDAGLSVRPESENVDNLDKNTEKIAKNQEKSENFNKNAKKMTRKELFEELYIKYFELPKKARRNKIVEEMLPYFEKQEYCESYVHLNLERKNRNLICRRIRMCRKANLANFNYFCTFTYDDKKHTEQSFKKKLRTCFRHLCERKHWRYLGVWERAPETNRLHFHGLFNIPRGSMPGEIVEVKDFDKKSVRMQTSFQNTYFNDRFGRSDFKMIADKDKDLGNELAYLMKYIEKTGEKIVYSKGLPQYFLSDIIDDDVVCTIGQEDKKLLLYDDFNCWDEGVLIGKVCPSVIEQMRKSN